MPICLALLMYGYSNFSLEKLEYCERNETLKRENYFIDLLNPEYNVAIDALAPMTGRKHTPEAIEKLRALGTGRVRSPKSRARGAASLRG